MGKEKKEYYLFGTTGFADITECDTHGLSIEGKVVTDLSDRDEVANKLREEVKKLNCVKDVGEWEMDPIDGIDFSYEEHGKVGYRSIFVLTFDQLYDCIGEGVKWRKKRLKDIMKQLASDSDMEIITKLTEGGIKKIKNEAEGQGRR